MVYFIYTCTGKKSNTLIKQYEEDMMRGNIIKGEHTLDQIIAMDKNNPKYLKLKISFLVNNCKKAQALHYIDAALQHDKDDIELLMLKVLLSDENDQRNSILNRLDLILNDRMNNSKSSRNSIISNLVIVRKLQKHSMHQIQQLFNKLSLTKDEKVILDNSLNLSNAEIMSAIPQCH